MKCELSHLLLYCRPGFESECAAEIQEQATALNVPGYARAKPDSGYVVFSPYEPGIAGLSIEQIPFQELIFARQMIASSELLKDLPVNDRITALLSVLEGMVERVSEVWIETPDTNEAKELLVFCRKFAAPFKEALQRAGQLDKSNPGLPRLHLLFLNSTTAYVGLSQPGNSSPWFMGIPRLRLLKSAPSRSALKLEEAFHTFLSPAERERWLRPGMTAVDLGAAPGGWTWQLVRRGIQVIAVDNGPLNQTLLESGLVEHRREDGFRYRPSRPVDWMVCDMVESPFRIARLVGQWLARGDCRGSIFNLKLPMKKRYAEVRHCQSLIAEELADIPYRLDLKQLYHDREEVTGYLRRIGHHR